MGVLSRVGRREWLLLLGSVLLTLTVAELVLRVGEPSATYDLMYRPSDDPVLGVELAQGADFEFDGLDVLIPPTRIRTGAQGHRGPDVAIPKPPGRRRVVCIGDSMTFGWGVEHKDTFCARLAPSLGPEWDAVNLGVPGYNTVQEVRMLELRGLVYEPDLVVMLFNGSDLEPPIDHGDAGGTWAWLVDHSAILRRVHRAFRGSEEDHTDAGRTAEPDFAPAVAAVAQLGKLGREHGFDSILLSFSDFGGRQALKEAAQTAGLVTGEAGPDFAGRDAELIIPGDGHPNARGHEVILARLLALVATLD
ncbi:MAG: SGNH/GDSL hydrolase family protein [Myxococcales bacterium]|nr:SGNH/GDSL hydrolase family protein [Myxococcales bacterium]